jgi:hypothetical protein
MFSNKMSYNIHSLDVKEATRSVYVTIGKWQHKMCSTAKGKQPLLESTVCSALGWRKYLGSRDLGLFIKTNKTRNAESPTALFTRLLAWDWGSCRKSRVIQRPVGKCAETLLHTSHTPAACQDTSSLLFVFGLNQLMMF